MGYTAEVAKNRNTAKLGAHTHTHCRLKPCQLREPQCPDVCSNIILDVSVWVSEI